MNSEAKNTNEFLLETAKIPGLVIFRNNCGALPDKRGVFVRFGVANAHGGSDFIGWFHGRFCAFEIKADKDNTDPERLEKQQNFIDQVTNSGGFAGFVKRPEDVKLILSGIGCRTLSDYPKDRLK